MLTWMRGGEIHVWRLKTNLATRGQVSSLLSLLLLGHICLRPRASRDTRADTKLHTFTFFTNSCQSSGAEMDRISKSSHVIATLASYSSTTIVFRGETYKLPVKRKATGQQDTTSDTEKGKISDFWQRIIKVQPDSETKNMITPPASIRQTAIPELTMVNMDICPCLDIDCPGCMSIPCPRCESLVIKNRCKCPVEQVIASPNLDLFDSLFSTQAIKQTGNGNKKRKLSHNSTGKVADLGLSTSTFTLPDTPSSLVDPETSTHEDDGLFF